MATGMYVYFENYGRYDWTRYFHGEGGLDLRWTPARQRMWRSRFRALNVSRTHVEVWHEDGSRRGDEEWETTLSPHLANDVVKQMLRQMPELLQHEGQRVIGRMPGSVLPIVVDDPGAALDEDEEDEGEYDAMDDENEPPLRNETDQAIEAG